MKHKIELLPEKKLVGKHLTMSLANNKTAELWQSFMLRRKEITNITGADLIPCKFMIPLTLITLMRINLLKMGRR